MDDTQHDPRPAGHERLAAVLGRIENAAAQAGTSAHDVQLTAVSKTFGPEAIVPVLKAGHRVFGENRVQEAHGKWLPLRERFCGVELHLIGPLQTNKAALAVQLFDVIETLDRMKLARVLADEIARAGKDIGIYVQVNTGAEAQKSGIDPHEADGFIAACRQECGLRIDGLMCIPPVHEPPSLHFALLAKIAKRNGIDILSMGMSTDFEIAIALGATHVRVGTAVFGPRGV